MSTARELRTHASERLQMLDWVSGETLDELLTNAMVFVLPSELEGLSVAPLDAMEAGLWVLTCDVPENREVVDGAGFTFRRGSAADLADRLRFLIANPEVRLAAGWRRGGSQSTINGERLPKTLRKPISR
jgi:glycosyltransferase involved in cell wall biosynthesis